MQIQTDDSAKWIFISIPVLLVLCILGAVALGATKSLSLHLAPSPAQKAEATAIAALAPTATAQALALQQQADQQQLEEKRQNDQISLAEKLAIAPERLRFKRTLWDLGTWSLIVSFLVAVVFAASRAYLAIRAARLPAARPIGPHLVVSESSQGPMLIDSLTGARALLKDAQGVSQLRALRLSQIEIAGRLAAAAESIARSTRQANPGDWLPEIGRPGPPGLLENAERPEAASHEPFIHPSSEERSRLHDSRNGD